MMQFITDAGPNGGRGPRNCNPDPVSARIAPY